MSHSQTQKIYVAASLPEAVTRIREELGPAAVILSTREVEGANGNQVEVVAGVPHTHPSVRDPYIGFSRVGGLASELIKLQEAVVHPLRFPDMYRRLGIRPPGGILLHGPVGCGKSLVVQTLIEECGASFFPLHGPSMLAAHAHGNAPNFQALFDQAHQKAPSIIFLDEIEAIGSNGADSASVEHRLLTQVLHLMDRIYLSDGVIVIAATNRPEDLDPALRRPGRFDREIEIPVPDSEGRLEILQIYTARMSLAPDTDLSAVAENTHGFTGADLSRLCQEAGMTAIRTGASRPVIHANHFEEALAHSRPDALKSLATKRPMTRWDDIGGMDEVKKALEDAIILPLRKPELFEKMRLRPTNGILLAGPPGTGKTLIARAAANECGVNFIVVNGPSLVSKYLGESERNIRDMFEQARQVQPCIVFLDEIDALAPVRGADAQNQHNNRLVSQLLVEMDGFSPSEGIFCLAASNRPDAIDPALKRPGRFDKIIEVPLPDARARKAIVEIHLKGRPMEHNIDWLFVEQLLDGLSGAEIEEVCRRASLSAIRKVLGTETNIEPSISQKDLSESILEMREANGLARLSDKAPSILVVDDLPEQLEKIQHSLEGKGMSVDVFL
ncbi:MAG: AAA family ATPase, partial [Planctomycetota bacterium]|nr:AAA family ATPase [Planctomycetota bacterium]